MQNFLLTSMQHERKVDLVVASDINEAAKKAISYYKEMDPGLKFKYHKRTEATATISMNGDIYYLRRTKSKISEFRSENTGVVIR